MWYKIRLTLWIILASILVIVILQNSGPVEITFLFWKRQVSKILLYPLLILCGAGIGLLGNKLWQRRKSPSAPAP